MRSNISLLSLEGIISLKKPSWMGVSGKIECVHEQYRNHGVWFQRLKYRCYVNGAKHFKAISLSYSVSNNHSSVFFAKWVIEKQKWKTINNGIVILRKMFQGLLFAKMTIGVKGFEEFWSKVKGAVVLIRQVNNALKVGSWFCK